MPLNIQVVAGQEFIRAMPTGELDAAQSRELLLDVAALKESEGVSKVLINLRHVEAKLSVTDVYNLVSEFARSKQGRHKRIAVLVAPEGFDHAAFLEMAAQNRGFELASFEDSTDSLDWLLGLDGE